MPTYDEKLLADAPEVTKADLQDGYNPELLREPTVKRTTSARVAPTSPRSNPDLHQHPLNDLEASAPLQPKEAPYDTGLGRKKQSFWRTTKGIVILCLVLLAIILAAVLGGVLGSRNQKKNVSLPNGAGQSGGGKGGPSASGTDGAGNGASGSITSSAIINPESSFTPTTKPSSTVVQGIGGAPSGVSTSGNTGNTAPSGADSGSQTGANGGSGTTVGDTVAVEPPSSGTGSTNV